MYEKKYASFVAVLSVGTGLERRPLRLSTYSFHSHSFHFGILNVLSYSNSLDVDVSDLLTQTCIY
jgi:hypothetical protein